MKELYTSPEMKLVCFAPVEKLASGIVDFDEFFALQGGMELTKNGASDGANDLDVNAAMDPENIG